MKNQCDIIKKFVCRAGSNVANQKECLYFMVVFKNGYDCVWQKHDIFSLGAGCACKKAQLAAEDRSEGK